MKPIKLMLFFQHCRLTIVYIHICVHSPHIVIPYNFWQLQFNSSNLFHECIIIFLGGFTIWTSPLRRLRFSELWSHTHTNPFLHFQHSNIRSFLIFRKINARFGLAWFGLHQLKLSWHTDATTYSHLVFLFFF